MQLTLATQLGERVILNIKHFLGWFGNTAGHLTSFPPDIQTLEKIADEARISEAVLLASEKTSYIETW